LGMVVASPASKHERGRLSEIGGQMSVADGSPVEKKPRETRRKKLGPKAEGPEGSRMELEPVLENEPHGIDTIRKTASNALHNKGGSIINKMTEKAEEGNVPCAKFLCVLGDEHKELTEAQVRRIEESLASEWTDEPEWLRLRLSEEAKNDDLRRLRML
jgi:hypothetical protein